ncbi:tryptophan synthase subunit beta [candidate division KSB1 bacterium]
MRLHEPDADGRFGEYGGAYVPEVLVPPLEELTRAYLAGREDDSFRRELSAMLTHYAGRPSPLYRAESLSADIGGATIWLKREDLNHTGSHKINNTLGQILLARRMGKKRIIAETGAGQHGVATATVTARYGLQCIVYMGAEDMERQAINVVRMRLLGAEVKEVTSGSKTLKDATNEAIRDWVSRPDDTYYLLGSTVGPHPYPLMVRDFQSVIGRETKDQMRDQTGKDPDILVACVGGGSNAIGLFHPFLDMPEVRKIGVEAGGLGLETGQHAATLSKGRPGVLHGSYSYLLQDDDGQVAPVHSISAGLDYPGVGPQHSDLQDRSLVEYVSVTDHEALAAFEHLSQSEGIIPALESAHALAYVERIAREMTEDTAIVVNLSGRGDKDLHTYMKEKSDEFESD